jgi:hypothetical protein
VLPLGEASGESAMVSQAAALSGIAGGICGVTSSRTEPQILFFPFFLVFDQHHV